MQLSEPERAPPMQVDRNSLTALAPDAGTLQRAARLARAERWDLLGRCPEGLWGELEGRDGRWRVAVREDFAQRCSCPVAARGQERGRGTPCKHGLGLLLLAASFGSLLRPLRPPPDLADWLTAARKPGTRQGAAPTARRRTEREATMRAGVVALLAWLEDRVRGGLADLGADPAELFRAQAARLIDAQAPRLGERLEAMALLAGQATRTAREELLAAMGRCALLCRAFLHAGQLPAELRCDLRRLLGWPLREAEVRTRGARVADRWLVLGRAEAAVSAQLQARRTWLYGLEEGRTALHLEFRRRAAAFRRDLEPGRVLAAELCFWPGRLPLRALVPAGGTTARFRGELPGTASLEDCLDAAAAAFAQQPFAPELPVRLVGVRVGGPPWQVVDRFGRALPLRPDDGWAVLALSGGAAVGLACEWDGRALRALGVAQAGRYEALAT